MRLPSARQVKKALSELEGIGAKRAAPLWERMRETLPAGLAESGELRVSVSPEAFVPWMAEHVTLRLVTGAHDSDTVSPVEVGSGLQSLLELATQQAAATTTGGSRIIAIEEPRGLPSPLGATHAGAASRRETPREADRLNP